MFQGANGFAGPRRALQRELVGAESKAAFDSREYGVDGMRMECVDGVCGQSEDGEWVESGWRVDGILPCRRCAPFDRPGPGNGSWRVSRAASPTRPSFASFPVCDLCLSKCLDRRHIGRSQLNRPRLADYQTIRTLARPDLEELYSRPSIGESPHVARCKWPL